MATRSVSVKTSTSPLQLLLMLNAKNMTQHLVTTSPPSL
ncbi:hypothetical protein EGR_10932 [Echinococcus granulosus]|uniref:Uncharacterized protein n=1 Tax=Echinococcus granulosus TaxID=6210 RepID=W6UL38_ECHGR|nr:hypothetical protein EGR_10932 [Echinococcus granulosus]EUB54214.1 hypothetical protein EGR_10932 [Echinococcus granulosus]